MTFFDFLSLKNDVNVPSKSNKQKKLCEKICFLLPSWRSMTKISGSGSISQRHGSADPDPDPPQNVMDPQHCSEWGKWGGRGKWWWLNLWLAVLRIRDVYHGSRIRIFSIPDLGSKRFRIPDSHQRISILTQKIVSKLSEIWSGLFIPDPDPDFLPIPDPGVKNAPDPGYGSANLQIFTLCLVAVVGPW